MIKLLLLLALAHPAHAQRIMAKTAMDNTTTERPFITGTILNGKVGLDVNIINQSGAGTAVSVTNFPTTQAVSGPLTDTQLRASALSTSVSNFPSVQTVSVNNLPATQAVTGSFWQSTQPVSLASAPTTPVTGTFWQSTQPVSLASAPTTPVTGTFWQSTQPVSIAATVAVSGPLTDTQIRATALPVSGTFWPVTQPVSGTFWQATQPVSGTLTCNAGSGTLAVSGTFFQATQPISAAALPLPSGAATSALQTTGNTSVASIDTKTPALGQALAAASVPVVLTAAQLTTLTPVSSVSVSNFPASQAVTGTFWQATQPVSGTVTANATLAAETTKVIGTVNIAASQNITATESTTAGAGNPCQNPHATLASTSGATSGTAAVQIIALSGSTKIHICALNVIGVSGTTPTFSLVYGTGSNCATGQATLVTSWSTTAGQLYNFAGPVAVTPAGQAICYLDTGTTPIQRYTMTYIQL